MTVIARDRSMASGSEINFLSRDEEVYPQLTRLYLDFNFRVLAIASGKTDIARQYLITYTSFHDHHMTAVTPAFDSLPALEEYTNDNIIEILHGTLFAEDNLPQA